MLKYSTRQDITVRKQSDKPTPKGSIASGAVWSILDNVAAQGITFVIFLVLARLLDPHLYGMLSVSILITQLFRTVIFESIATSIIRKHEPTDEDFNTAFLSCCIFAVPAFLIVFFSANILENMMHIQGLGDVIRGTSVIILVSGLSKVHEAWLTHRLLFRSLAIRSITSIGLGGIVGVYLAWIGLGSTWLVMQQVVTSVAATITLWLATPWKPRLRFSMASFKESMRFSRHVALSGMTNFANQNSDIFFITYYLGSAAAGVYSAGKRIVNTLNTVMATALMRVSLPAFSRVKNQLDEFKSHYLNATFFTILLTAPAFIGLCYLSHDVTWLLLGQKWMASVPVMQIVSATGFIVSIGYYNHTVMFARDRPDWQSRLTLLYAVTNITVFFIFVRYGLVAMALSYSLRTLLLYPVSAWCALTLLNVTWKEYLAQITSPIIGSLVMCLGLFAMDSALGLKTGWEKLLLDIAAGAVIYGLYVLIFIPRHKLAIFSNAVAMVRNRKKPA